MEKFSIYEFIQKEYPKFPTDVLMDLFRINKKFKKFDLPDLSYNFELKTNFVGKLGLIRVADELNRLSESEWNQIIKLIPELKKKMTIYYTNKSLKGDLAIFENQPTTFFGHVSQVDVDNMMYICIDHLLIYDTGQSVGSHTNHVWLRKIIYSKFPIKIGDFVVFEATSYRYKSGVTRKWGLRLINDDAISIISLSEAKRWFRQKKEDAKNYELANTSKFYGKPKTYHRIGS